MLHMSTVLESGKVEAGCVSVYVCECVCATYHVNMM